LSILDASTISLNADRLQVVGVLAALGGAPMLSSYVRA